jgi:uncharacterized DUF497 family protein
VHQPFEYQFEWDPVKARGNYNKHGITFERAASVFNDPRALSIPDEKHSEREERWIILGLDQGGVPVVVCHAFRYEEGHHKARVRIISARKATKKEVQQYKEI